MNYPKVSVIVPVYKVPLEYLRACFDSLTAQTMQECEFIVVSDGAPEAECSICEEYVARDSRFKFFKREHAGVSATRNYGIDQAQGEYFAFVDSDDWIEPEMLQICYMYASNKKIDLMTMDYFITNNGIDYYREQNPHSTDYENFLRLILEGKIFGGMQLRIIRSIFYKQHPIKWNENLGYCEDVVFWTQLLPYNPQMMYVNKSFYHYVQDNNLSITRDYTIEKFNERKKFIKILKETLPIHFSKAINIAAFNVKLEAWRHHLLTIDDYVNFEKTTFRTLFKAQISIISKLYFIFNAILFKLFKRTYKPYL